MKLFYAPNSPFVRKVLVLLAEAKQEGMVELVPATGTPLDPGSIPLAQNPLGKIPCLERDDGASLYDSRVITRYLDDRFDAGLYPAVPRLWETLVLEATADGIADAAVAMMYEMRVRDTEKRSDPWIEGQWAKIARALDALEARWMSHLAGPLDMGQVALGCALGYVDFRHGERGWREGRSALGAWADTFANRPAMAKTAPN